MYKLHKYVVYFDTPFKAMACKQFMEQNEVTFDEATKMLGYDHGVDFLLCLDSVG